MKPPMPSITMRNGEKIKVFGPAALTVEKGGIEVLGKRFGRGEKLIVHKLRSYTVVAREDSVLELVMGEGASLQPVEPGDPYEEWLKTAREIVGKGYKTIMVLGGVDDGKSSFSILLSNIVLDENGRPAIIDADMGQADIGPPGFISLAYPEKQVVWMRELKPASMRFIGDIKPQNNKARVIHAIRVLASKALSDGRSPVIIDTDGWIADSYALAYKSQMIEEVMPEAIVILGCSYHGYFRRYTRLGIQVYELPSPTVRRNRSREERRSLRSDKYREFLGDAGKTRIRLDDVILSGSPVFTGLELDRTELSELLGVKIAYASRTPDTVYIVLGEPARINRLDTIKKVYGVDRVRIYYRGFEKDMYVSITGNDGNDYPAVIEYIDYDNKEVVLRTKYTNVKPWIIRFSCIKLTPEYTEQIIE